MRRTHCAASLGLAIFLASATGRADEVQPPAKAATPFRMKLEGGAAYRRMFSLPQSGAEFSFYGGFQTSKAAAFYADLGLLVGKTESLPTRTYRLGLSVDAHYGRFHGGGELRLSIMELRRATTGEGYRDLGLGLHGFVAFDLVRVGDHAIYLAGSMNVDLYGLYGNLLRGPYVWGPSAALGFRY